MSPLISVIVPVYNGARFVDDALNSIRAEGHARYEVVLVDDGSDDDSVAQALSWADQHQTERGQHASALSVQVLTQPHSGPAVARNRGIAAASAELLAFLDVDDLWPAGRTQRLLSRLDAADQPAVVMGRVQWQALEATQEDRFLLQHFAEPDLGAYIPAALFRRQVFEQVGLLDPDLRHGEDLDLFNRLKEQRIGIATLEQTSYIYRRHRNNMTRGQDIAAKQFPLVIKKSLERRRAAARDQASSLPTLRDYLVDE